MITVGTGNPRDTLDPAHRQRLMSIVDVAPNIIVATGDLVEPETWRRAQLTHPDRWKLSMPKRWCSRQIENRVALLTVQQHLAAIQHTPTPPGTACGRQDRPPSGG